MSQAKGFTATATITCTWTKEEIQKLIDKEGTFKGELTDELCQDLVNSFIWNTEGGPGSLPEEKMNLNDAAHDFLSDILGDDFE